MPPNSPKNPSRPTVYLTPETLALLQSAAPRGYSLSGRVNAVTDRYHAATADTLARLLPQFTGAEQQQILTACWCWATTREPVDILRDGITAEIADAAQPGGDLAGQNVAELLEKLHALPLAERLALIEWIEEKNLPKPEKNTSTRICVIVYLTHGSKTTQPPLKS